MRRIAWLALALACGGEAASPEPQGKERIIEVRDGVPVYSAVNEGLILDGSDSDLGHVSQLLLFAPSGSRQPGFAPGDETSCVTTGGLAQNCIVPPVNGLKKRFVYYIDGGFGPRIEGFGVARFDIYSQLTQMYTDLVAQGAESSGAGALDYGETTDLDDPDLTYIIDVSDSDFCAGTSSKGNVCFTGSTTGISRDSTLVGSYHRMVNVPAIHIDYESIRTHAGWTTANKRNALHQAIVLAFLKGIGQGPKNISLSTRCDQVTVTTGFWCTLPPTAACKLNGWGDFGNPGSISLLGSNCGD